MVTISEDGDVVTVIVLFETEPEEQQELIDAITAEVDRWISDLPGFIASTFHASLDGTRVVNYAQWDSQADLERFANHDEWSVLNEIVEDLGFEEFGDFNTYEVAYAAENSPS